MNEGPRLTEEQQAAVAAPDGAYLVVAPPGSGKTEVLIRRVLHLIEASPNEPFRVLALTYTNRAAAELDQRARATVADDAWRVTATTLHGFCLDMLQRYGETVGVVGEVSVLDSDDLRLELLAHALRAVAASAPDPGSSRALQELLSAIDGLRSELVVPDFAPSTPVLAGEVTLAQAYAAYEEALDDSRALDFPGMLYRAWRLLSEDPWVGRHYRRQYRHLLVDEAQDLTQTHADVLRALCGGALRNVFLVADDDQEIFGFAGASSRHYVALAQELEAEPLVLTTNFRSARRIVAAAESLRSHITTIRVDRPPAVPATAADGWIEFAEHHDRQAEGSAVVEWVSRLLDDGLPPDWLHPGEDATLRAEDVCVMARTRYGFDAVVDALEDVGIPYVLRTEEAGLFDSPAGRVLYFGLRLLANPHDHASRRRLQAELAQPRDAVTVAENAGVYGSDADPMGGGGLSGDAWADAFDLPAPLRPVLAGLPGPVPVDDVASLRDLLGDAELGAELWAADRDRLLQHWEMYAAGTRAPDRSLPGFLRRLSRLQRTPPDAAGVRLLTPYRAKGLQFRVVAITGMSEGMFPYYRATTPRAIDEERRAAYVAVTRAARGVLLTRPARRSDRFGRIHRDPPSPFLAELGLRVG